MNKTLNDCSYCSEKDALWHLIWIKGVKSAHRGDVKSV